MCVKDLLTESYKQQIGIAESTPVVLIIPFSALCQAIKTVQSITEYDQGIISLAHYSNGNFHFNPKEETIDNQVFPSSGTRHFSAVQF